MSDTAPALTETQLVTLTLWGEDRGERIEGRIAVGCVIRNRVRSHRFGDTFGAVCVAPYQFSCWRPQGGAANYAAVQAMAVALSANESAVTDRTLRECGWIAHGIIGDWIQDQVKGATHYHVADLEPLPAWAIGKTPVARVGSHLFYAGIK